MELKFTGERMMPDINREELIYLEHMSRYFFAAQFIQGKKVLDVSCGSGYGSYYLLERGSREVTGVDITSEAIQYAQKRYQAKKLTFIKADAENLPFPDQSFDIVVSFETIEHLHRQKKFLQEVKRILNISGVFIISTPNAYAYPKGNKYHIKELKPKQLRKLIGKYFKNFKLFYQDSIISNFILDSNTAKKNIDFQEIKIKNVKLFDLEEKKHMYLIGIASNSSLPETQGNIVLGYLRELENIKKMIVLLSEHLKRKTTEIESIYRSRGWKIISFMHSIRIKIPILKNL